MGNVVEFEVFRDYLKVAADDPAVDDVSRLFDAITKAVHRITRRAYEGDEGGSYDQVIRIRGAREFTLPYAPIRVVTSITRVFFDGTEETPYVATDWRVEDPILGRLRLNPGFNAWLIHGRLEEQDDSAMWPLGRPVDHQWGGPDYVRVVWTTTGEIPADVVQATLDWGRIRWNERDRDPELQQYRTGVDLERYFDKAGKVPHAVVLALLGDRHSSFNGVV